MDKLVCLSVLFTEFTISYSIGGRRGSRTLTSLRRRDFKSLVSAIPPPAHPNTNTKNGGGTGIRTLDNGFAIRCLSPLGHAASYTDNSLNCSNNCSYTIPKYVFSQLFISQELRYYYNNIENLTVYFTLISNTRLYI